MRIWRNWQTRKIQVLIAARLCKFKSCYPHHESPENWNFRGFQWNSSLRTSEIQLCCMKCAFGTWNTPTAYVGWRILLHIAKRYFIKKKLDSLFNEIRPCGRVKYNCVVWSVPTAHEIRLRRMTVDEFYFILRSNISLEKCLTAYSMKFVLISFL